MSDIKLPPLPETVYGLFYEARSCPGDDDEGYQELFDEPGYTADQMKVYARAAIEAQRVPDGFISDVIRSVAELEYTSIEGAPAVMQVTADELAGILSAHLGGLSSAPPVAQPAEPEGPICERCDGSGEALVMEGRGPDTYELLVPCPHCDGTGEAQPAERKPLTTEEVIRLWHEDDVATRRTSAFEWYAAGILVAERAHGIGD